jgi:selenocysteine lyase/cysteine desulfurase
LSSSALTSAKAPPLDRKNFPIARSWAYCNHAAVGPLPRSTRDALVAAVDAHMVDGCEAILQTEARSRDVRAQVARITGAQPGELAFMRSTSDGALLIANGLDWRAGDEVILSDNEFGANAYPWLHLRDRGVSVKLIRTPHARLSVSTLERMRTPRTRLVAVSYVSFNDGYRHDLRAIGRWCRDNGILLAVDAIQGFGHLPLELNAWKIDFCYFGVAKWLLSPQGLSVVFVRAELVERLRPVLCSWRSVESPMRFLDYAQPLAAGAQRFEAATINYPAVVAFGESLRILAASGLAALERHVLALGDRLIRGATAAGVEVLSDTDPRTRSGIILLGRRKRSVEELMRRAAARRVGVTIREDGVRVSPHGYNDETDIDAVVELLSA